MSENAYSEKEVIRAFETVDGGNYKTLAHYRPACYDAQKEECQSEAGCPDCMTNGKEQNPTRFQTQTDDNMLLYYYVDYCPVKCEMSEWCVICDAELVYGEFDVRVLAPLTKLNRAQHVTLVQERLGRCVSGNRRLRGRGPRACRT